MAVGNLSLKAGRKEKEKEEKKKKKGKTSMNQ